ncbi:hypothetical protein ABW21_db0203658 [Orbilia brochopaga]|nr:hypothetical protein ABW21_db0203658 [Drechslerella brochopaga]
MAHIGVAKPTRLAVCGFGVRGRLFHNIYIAEQLALLWSGRPIDKKPRIHDYYDMQFEEEGPGTAFQMNSSAALNTGLDEKISINTEGLTAEQSTIIHRIVNVSPRYAELALENQEELTHRLLKENTLTAALFCDAVKSGKIDTSVACGPRDLAGRALEAMTREASELARKYLPWLKISIRHGVRAIDVDLRVPTRPLLTVEDLRTGSIETGIQYDLIIKTTGMTSGIPVSGDMKQNAYTGIPRSDSVAEYLDRHDILDDEGTIIPGKKIFIGGAGLSAYDFMGIVLARTKILKFDPISKQVVIDEEVAEKYRGLITIFNRTDGMLSPPRHNTATITNQSSEFITPDMLLSMQLRKGCSFYPMFVEICRILTAITCDKLPSQIEPMVSTIDQLDQYALENERIAGNAHAITEVGLFRRWLSSCAFSLTTSSTPEQERAELKQKYPLLLRDIWQSWRSMSYSATHSIGEAADSNLRHRTARRAFLYQITAVPWQIHVLVTRLYKLGVIDWTQGSYDSMRWSPDEKQFMLSGLTADGLIAPRVFSPTFDKLAARIISQTRKPRAGEKVYQKGRFPLSRRSGEYAHVMELGLPGHGTLDEKMLRNQQWFDTNSYHAACQMMPIIVGTASLIESMTLSGVPQPVSEIVKYYRASLPDPRAFEQQVDRIESSYNQLVQLIKFSRLIEKSYPDRFVDKMRCIKSYRKRQEIFVEIKRKGDKIAREALAEYFDELDIERFIPITLEGFEDGTPDFTSDQMERMRALWRGTDRPKFSARPGSINDHRSVPAINLNLASQTSRQRHARHNTCLLPYNHVTWSNTAYLSG